MRIWGTRIYRKTFISLSFSLIHPHPFSLFKSQSSPAAKEHSTRLPATRALKNQVDWCTTSKVRFSHGDAKITQQKETLIYTFPTLSTKKCVGGKEKKITGVISSQRIGAEHTNRPPDSVLLNRWFVVCVDFAVQGVLDIFSYFFFKYKVGGDATARICLWPERDGIMFPLPLPLLCGCFFPSLSLFFPFLWPFRRHLQGQPTDVSTIWNAQQSTNSSAAVYVVKRTVAKHICQSCPVKMMTGLDRSLLPLFRKRIYII